MFERFTDRARKGEIDPILGRDDEIRQIVHVLMRRRQNNPILTGEAGVGKTAVVEGFAQRIASGDVPPSLKDVTLRALQSEPSPALAAILCAGLATVIARRDNSFGQITSPPGLSNIVAIAAGGNHSLALKADGTVAAWGQNVDGEGFFAGQSVVPSSLSNVIAIAAGDYHSLALKADGSVTAWGDNSQGQCAVPRR